MSNNLTDELVDNATDALSLAYQYQEYYTGTWAEESIQTFVDALQRDLKAKDYEDAFMSLGALNACLWRFSEEIADDARREMYGAELFTTGQNDVA